MYEKPVWGLRGVNTGEVKFYRFLSDLSKILKHQVYITCITEYMYLLWIGVIR